MKSREQSRFVAVSQPYAGAWHAVPPDHTKATQLATPLWTSVMQRHLGLHLSALKPTLEELHEAGLEAGDYFGDKDTNEADHNRRHNGGMRGWYDAIAAVATSQTVLGDKTNAAKTKQFNDFKRRPRSRHRRDRLGIGFAQLGAYCRKPPPPFGNSNIF